MEDVKVTFGGNPVKLADSTIQVGDKAPDFVVINENLEHKRLSDFSGKIILLTVYPSIDTNVCAAQNRRMNEEAVNMGDDVVVLSISADLPFAQKRFCAAEGLNSVITLSDHAYSDFGKKYGFLMEDFRLLARGNVIIDKNNVVRYVEFVPEVGNEPDYEKTMEALKEVKQS